MTKRKESGLIVCLYYLDSYTRIHVDVFDLAVKSYMCIHVRVLLLYLVIEKHMYIYILCVDVFTVYI